MRHALNSSLTGKEAYTYDAVLQPISTKFLKFGDLSPLASSLWTAEYPALAFWAVGFTYLSRFSAEPLRRVIDIPKREFASPFAQL